MTSALRPLGVVALFGLTACEPETRRPPPNTGTPAGTPGGTVPTGVGTPTGDTGTTITTTVTTTYDCTTPWPNLLGGHVVGSITPTEDFDITADGRLIHIESGNLVERDLTGNNFALVAANVSNNAAGIRVLATGDILVAAVDSGTLFLVSRATGSKVAIYSGNWPNGLDVDEDHNVYVTDFADNGSVTRINAYYPADREVIADGVYRPNGVAITQDRQRLYIAANWIDRIYAVDRNLDGTWGTPWLFQDNPGAAQSVTLDVCGTVYWESGSDIKRKTGDETDGGLVANLGGGYFPNLRFGNDMGGFKRDHLYGLSGGNLVEVHVGVPGKKHVAFVTP